MVPGRSLLSLAGASLLLFGCESNTGPAPLESSMVLGGVEVDAETLNEGQDHYLRHCQACHGLDGDGRGPAAPGLRPPPRDFRTGTFKFSGVMDGLPRDEDLMRLIDGGLHGTAMLEWDLPESTLRAIVHYIKTFSPEGSGFRDPDEVLGEPVVPTEDPWAGRTAEALKRGDAVYHGYATCQTCHPAYATKPSIWEAGQAFGKTAEFRKDMYLSELKDSDYEVEGVTMKILPPDFTWDKVRSARDGHLHEDLYRVIGAGIGGTAMPAWKGSISEEDLWALGYYVGSLMEMRETPEGTALRTSLANQPEFTPPAPATEEGDEETENAG